MLAPSLGAWSMCALGAAALALAGQSRGAPPALPLFIEAAEASGLQFVHVNGASGQYYMAEQMGPGVALLDYDGDGDLDLFVLQGGALDETPAHAPGAATSRLFRNDLTVSPDGTRTLRFTDVTERAGLGWRGYGMGVAVADYDNDGHLDLFLTGFGDAALFRNMGDGTFTDVTAAAGLGSTLWSTSAAFLDYDQDGHLDLFVASYLDFTLADNKTCTDSLGARDYCSPRAYRPVQDRLYRNDGNRRFTDVTGPAGMLKATGAGLGVAVGDYNQDGWLDIYVANDATPNQLWINRRDGTFMDDGPLSGAAVNAVGNPEGSMGLASGDADADGDEDLFITNIIGETFVLYENDGAGSFEDVRARWGLARPTAAFTGFGTDWLDYDNDGWLDLFVANGAVNVIEQQRGQPLPFRMRNQLFRNTGARRMIETTDAAGPAFAELGIGRGAAFGDIDNDGDIDIVFTNNGGPLRLLLNQTAAKGAARASDDSGAAGWLQIRLEQSSGNRFGLGAWVGVERSGLPTLWRRVKTDGSYLSASDMRLHVGLGAAPVVSAVVVQWPDGHRERWPGPRAGQLVTLRRGSAPQAAGK